MVLYELTEKYKILEEMIYDPEVDEQVLKDTMDAVWGEIEIKADSYAKIIAGIDAYIKGAENEVARLTARAKTMKERREALKANLEFCMRETGKTKFRTELFSFNIQKNGGLQPLVIDEPEKIPEEYLIPQPAVPNNTAIRQFLSEHVAEWAHLAPRGESLRIR